MGTIVVIVAFLLAATANPIDDASHHSSGEYLNTIGHDGSHSSPEELPKDDAQVSGEDTTVPHDVEHGSSSTDSPVSNGDDSHNQDEESVSPSDTPSVSTSSDASNNSGQAVSSSVSTATPVSTERPIAVDTDPTNVTEPPDADPYDCKNRNPRKHIYEACTFTCGGDMVATALDHSKCLLNYTGNFTETNEPTGLKENATGVCVDGACIPKPNNATETTPQSSTATTITISEKTPEPSVTYTDTTENHESSSPESNTNHNESVVAIGDSSQPPPSPQDDVPVAME